MKWRGGFGGTDGGYTITQVCIIQHVHKNVKVCVGDGAASTHACLIRYICTLSSCGTGSFVGIVFICTLISSAGLDIVRIGARSRQIRYICTQCRPKKGNFAGIAFHLNLIFYEPLILKPRIELSMLEPSGNIFKASQADTGPFRQLASCTEAGSSKQ